MNLGDIKTLAKQRSDMVNSSFVSDSEWNSYINASLAELYDILVSRFEDYFVDDPVAFTIASGAYDYTLPSTFYKLIGVDYLVSGSSSDPAAEWISVDRYNFQERNARGRSGSRVISGYHERLYRIIGAKLRIVPESNAAGTYRYWQIPRLTRLTADSDNLPAIMDYEEYVVIDAAIKAKEKEESDVSALMAEKEAMRQRVLAMSSNRDAAGSTRVADVGAQAYMSDFVIPR